MREWESKLSLHYRRLDKSRMVSGVTNSTKEDAGVSQEAILTKIRKYFEFALDAQWAFGCCTI
jgi:hypothetical protein